MGRGPPSCAGSGRRRAAPAGSRLLTDTEDVAAEVEATLDGLSITHKPKIGGVGSVIPKRMNGTMSKTYEVSMRGAAAHAAAAADRAAASPFGGIPVPPQPMHSSAKADGSRT